MEEAWVYEGVGGLGGGDADWASLVVSRSQGAAGDFSPSREPALGDNGTRGLLDERTLFSPALSAEKVARLHGSRK